MKRRRTTGFSFHEVVVLAVVLACLTVRACGDTPAYELLIEHSPAKAGRVTPNSGTHRYAANATVPLSADPQPGYQFAYWLGDVTDPDASRTTVTVNEPKVVVAVFRPVEKNHLDDRAQTGGGGGGFGPGALIPTATHFSIPGWGPSGGARARKGAVPVPVPVPVVVTPEPSTIALLALGALVLRQRRR